MNRIFLNLALIALLMLVVPFQAQAETFDGDWEGQGELEVDNIRAPIDCDSVEFTIIQTDSRLEIRGGRALCEQFTFVYPRMRFRVDDGIVYDGNIAIGMTGEGYAHFIFSVREGNLNVVDIRQSSLGMQIVHTQSDWGRTGSVLRATLAKDETIFD